MKILQIKLEMEILILFLTFRFFLNNSLRYNAPYCNLIFIIESIDFVRSVFSHENAIKGHEGANGEAGDGADTSRSTKHTHACDVVATDGGHTEPHGRSFPQVLSGSLSSCDSVEIFLSIQHIEVVKLENMLIDLRSSHWLMQHSLALGSVHIN